jgi:signal transduction histidine kinase
VVLAAAQTGKQPNPLVQTAELFEIIERNARDLASLVEELLIAARLEQGEAAAEPVRVDLADLVRTVARDFGVTDRPVEVEVAEEFSTMSDPDAIRRILVNLLDNAHKYGGGSVRLATASGEGRWRLEIRDQGRGFAPETAEKLFDLHNRGSGEGVTHGAGLGLAIARQLARRMGGDISAYSAGPGLGAVFTVTMLLAPQSALPGISEGAAHG